MPDPYTVFAEIGCMDPRYPANITPFAGQNGQFFRKTLKDGVSFVHFYEIIHHPHFHSAVLRRPRHGFTRPPVSFISQPLLSTLQPQRRERTVLRVPCRYRVSGRACLPSRLCVRPSDRTRMRPPIRPARRQVRAALSYGL